MSDPTAGSRGRHPFSYSWVMLATGFCITVPSSGLNMSFGGFVRALINDYGWTTSMVSPTYTIFMISAGITSITAGRLADRFSPRLIS